MDPDLTTLADVLARAAALLLPREEAAYLHSHNPIFAWRAYRIARQCGVPLPAWVSAYVDRCAERILGATAADQIAAALNLDQPGGGAWKARQAEKTIRDRDRLVGSFLAMQDRPTANEIRASLAEARAAAAPKDWARLDALTRKIEAVLRDWIDDRTDPALDGAIADAEHLAPSTVQEKIDTWLPARRKKRKHKSKHTRP